MSDLVTVLSLEDFEFQNGLRSAASETRAFAAETSSAFEHIEGRLHRVEHAAAHLAVAFSFNISEGTGPDALAHKLEHVASLAPTIGLALGHLGGTIGAIAPPIGIAVGLLGAALIPKMMESAEAAKEMAEAIKEAGTEFERMIGKERGSIGFERRLNRITAETSPESIQSQKENAEDTAAELRDEISRRRFEFRKQVGELATKGGLEGDLAGKFGPNNEERGAFNFRSQGNEGQDLSAEAKAAKEMYDRLKEAEDQLERMDKRAGALGDKLEASKEFQKRKEDQEFIQKQLENEQKIREEIAKEIETPYEKAKKHLAELQSAQEGGIITPEMFDKAADKTLQDFAKAQGHSPEQINAGVSKDRSYEAIRASIRSAENGADTPELAALREQLETSRKQLKATQDLAEKLPQEVVIP